MTMSINIYIDGDILVYQSIWGATKTKDIKNKLDQTISNIMSDLEGGKGMIAIKGIGNFRKDIYPEYKGNRKKELTEEEKMFFEYAYNYLKDSWSAYPADNMEADDLLAIWQTEEPGITVSIDKDMLQVPGLHYNTRRKEYMNITEEKGSLLLHTQVMMGDSVDNITGLKGIGKVKAAQVLDGVPMNQHLSKVKAFWKDYYGRGWEDNLQLNMDLIYLRRTIDDRYDIRTGQRATTSVQHKSRKELESSRRVSSELHQGLGECDDDWGDQRTSSI